MEIVFEKKKYLKFGSWKNYDPPLLVAVVKLIQIACKVFCVNKARTCHFDLFVLDGINYLSSIYVD